MDGQHKAFVGHEDGIDEKNGQVIFRMTFARYSE